MARTSPKPIVLVVDDEAVIRHAAVEMVEEAGFAALEAHDGAQAMELLDTVDGVGVVLTDIDMPASIDGIRLAACIQRKWPRVGIIVASGKVSPKRGDIPAGALLFFAKPYTEAEVVAAIRRFLDRPSMGQGTGQDRTSSLDADRLSETIPETRQASAPEPGRLRKSLR